MGPGSGIDADSALWQGLIEYSESYTCYSAALAAWSAFDVPSWRDLVNTGLTLDLVEADGGLFGFAHFPPGVQARLQLRRTSTDDPEQAAAGILAELESAGRVIVAGDGFSLPWHVAAGRRHVPHWFLLAGPPAQPVVVDPFAARNDLGLQEATPREVDPATLATLAQAHPGDDDVIALREAFALGRDGRWVEPRRFQWFVRGEAVDPVPDGASGPAAVRRLARHFREHGDEEHAYRQVDDIWSVARHRAFLARLAAGHSGASGGAVADWVETHVGPLAKRWSHMAPLLFQAVLAIGGGRRPTGSVATTLDELAEREQVARDDCPPEAKTLLPSG
jgi:hypothetical protein